jgi:hypothetical protein
LGGLAKDELLADYFENNNFHYVRNLYKSPLYRYVEYGYRTTAESNPKIAIINKAYYNMLEEAVNGANIIKSRCDNNLTRSELVPWILMQFPLDQWAKQATYFQKESEACSYLHWQMHDTYVALRHLEYKLKNKDGSLISEFATRIKNLDEILLQMKDQIPLNSRVPLAQEYRSAYQQELASAKAAVTAIKGKIKQLGLPNKYEEEALIRELKMRGLL